MIEEGFIRNGRQDIFHFTQIGGLADLFAVGQPEDKLTESQILHKKTSDFRMESGRVFIQKDSRDDLRQFAIGFFGAEIK